jgi:gas vesicle protein
MSLRFILGFIIGFMLGASVALALAPQPGAATRQQLWEKVKERARRNNAGD